MPFRPKYIPLEEAPADETGEFQLTCDMAGLGRQLQAEANALAETYPADANRIQRTSAVDKCEEVSPSRGRTHAISKSGHVNRGRLALLASLTLAVGLISGLAALIAFVPRDMPRTVENPSDRRAAHETEPALREPADPIAPVVSLPERNLPPTSASANHFPLPMTPVWHFHEVSPPKREGLLDLESETNSRIKVSI